MPSPHRLGAWNLDFLPDISLVLVDAGEFEFAVDAFPGEKVRRFLNGFGLQNDVRIVEHHDLFLTLNDVLSQLAPVGGFSREAIPIVLYPHATTFSIQCAGIEKFKSVFVISEKTGTES
jgi:hypothetical protein